MNKAGALVRKHAGETPRDNAASTDSAGKTFSSTSDGKDQKQKSPL